MLATSLLKSARPVIPINYFFPRCVFAPALYTFPMSFTYRPEGTCSQEMTFDIIDGKVRGLKIRGGCRGNRRGLSALVEGVRAARMPQLAAAMDGRSRHECR